MGGLVALLISLQSTVGPVCYLNEQDVVPDLGLYLVANTLYLPTVVASEYVPPIGTAVGKIVEEYCQLWPGSRRPDLISGGRM